MNKKQLLANQTENLRKLNDVLEREQFETALPDEIERAVQNAARAIPDAQRALVLAQTKFANALGYTSAFAWVECGTISDDIGFDSTTEQWVKALRVFARKELLEQKILALQTELRELIAANNPNA